MQPTLPAYGRAAAWFLTLLAALTVILIVVAIPTRAEEKPDLDLDSYAGKVVLVDFWASWCSPCRKAFPWLNDMQAKYADQGLVIVGVNLDEERADAQGFLDSVPAHFDLVYDPQGALAIAYKVEAMPSSFVIGRSGDIVARHYGFLEEKTAQYEQALVQALGLSSTAVTDEVATEDSPTAH